MGNCCISSNQKHQLSAKNNRPKESKKSINEKETRSSVSVTYVSTGKSSPTNGKRKQGFENGASARSDGKTLSTLNQTDEERKNQASNEASKKPDFCNGLSDQKLESFFTKYKDKNEDSILADGTENLCQDLKLDPTEFRVLILAWKFNVSQMCRFTRQEFMDGCKALKVGSIKSLQSKLTLLSEEVDSKENFRDLYRFTYGFGLDVEDGQRTLPTPVAIDLWKLVFSKNSPIFLQEWITFLEEKQVKGISRDTWNMFLYLYETVNSDFSNYDESEAWPSLFDEFVAKKFEDPEKGTVENG